MAEIDSPRWNLPRRRGPNIRPATTRDDLVRKLKHFERAIDNIRGLRPGSHSWPKLEYRLDYSNGGVRIETMDQSRPVSPRLSKRGLVEWIDAALIALSEVTRT